MRPKPKFRRVCLANDDGTRRAQPRNEQLVLGRNEIAQHGRALRRRQPRHIGKILDRNRQPMQWPAGAGVIGGFSLFHQLRPIAPGDDGVDVGVQRINPRQRVLHQLCRRELARRKIAQNLTCALEMC
jgi:hypothetical protein